MKRRWPLLAALGAVAPAGGCAALDSVGGPPERVAVDRTEAFARPPTPAGGPVQRWVVLGAVMADGRQDGDSLWVAPERERHYSAIGLRTEDSRIAIDDVVVEFVDGTRTSLRAPRILEEGETASIPLPADDRRVRAVHFRYSELRRGGPGATLQVWAR
jgi:hypothetical protein